MSSSSLMSKDVGDFASSSSDEKIHNFLSEVDISSLEVGIRSSWIFVCCRRG